MTNSWVGSFNNKNNNRKERITRCLWGNLWDREEKGGLSLVCAIFLGAERSMQEREILLGYKEKTLSCRAGVGVEGWEWGGGGRRECCRPVA